MYAAVAICPTRVDAVLTCEIKYFQHYFRGLLQFMNIFHQHVQYRWNNFEIILVFLFHM